MLLLQLLAICAVSAAPSAAGAAPMAPIRPPAYHFVPPCWTNDPSLLYVSETRTWHNYYQAPLNGGAAAPWAPGSGGGVWRHASTLDFVSWLDHGAVNGTQNEGTGTLLAAPPGVATPAPFLRAFAGDGGVSLGAASDADVHVWADVPPFPRAAPPPPPANSMFGDPFFFYDSAAARWVLLISTCLGGRDYSTCVLPRVERWEASDVAAVFTKASDFFVGPAPTGIRPECPRAWRFPRAGGGTRDLLVYSSTLQARSLWWLGDVNASGVFVPVAQGQMDWGASYASHLSPLPGSGSSSWGGAAFLGVAWVHEGRPQSDAVPWFNTMQAPRNVSLAEDGLRLSAAPADYIRALRTPLWAGNVSAAGAGGASLALALPPAVSGVALWLEAALVSWAPCSGGSSGAAGEQGAGSGGSGGSWGLRVRASGAGAADEWTSVAIVDGAPSALVVDSTRSSLDPTMARAVYTAPASAAAQLAALTLLLDESVVEAFAHSDVQGEVAVTARAYPALTASTGVWLEATPPAASAGVCVAVRAFTMGAAESPRGGAFA